MRDSEERGHDRGGGIPRGHGVRDRHGHHREEQSQQTVPIQVLAYSGEAGVLYIGVNMWEWPMRR